MAWHNLHWPRDVPPTAGLPLRWRDFYGAVPGSLEAGLAEMLRVPAVQVECSGTVALIVALETLKRRSRRRGVVIPAYTCPLVPLAVSSAGLEVKLCDTAPDRFDLDAESLARCVDQDTLCVIPTHLAGSVAALAPVLDLAARAGAYVIEDAAQALGATWRGQAVGTVGDIGIFSLACGKGLTLYEGGVLCARDPALRAELQATGRALIPRARRLEALRCAQLVGYRLLYHPFGLRFSYGMGLRYWLKRREPARAVGDVFGEGIPRQRVSRWRRNIGARALPRLSDALRQNAERAGRRVAALQRVPGLTVVRDLPESVGTWPFIMVLCRSAAVAELVLAELWTAGIGVSKLFVHDLQGYAYLRRLLPATPAANATAFAARQVTISNSPWSTDADFARVLGVLSTAHGE